MMTFSQKLFCSVLFSLYIITVVAQSDKCVVYKGEISSCVQYIPNGTLIYVPPGQTYEQLIADVKSNAQNSFNIIIPTDCQTPLLKISCSALATCVKVGDQVFGQPVCTPICSDTLEPCKTIFAFTKTPNCTSYDNSTNAPIFMEPGTTFNKTVGTDTVSVGCNPLELTNETLVITCVYPTAKTRDGKCGIQCPDPMYSHRQYEVIDVLTKVLGWGSLAFLIVIVATFIGDKQRRVWPNNIPYLMCISSLVQLIFTVVIPTFYNIGKKTNSHFCASEAEVSTQADGNAVCIMQGIATIYTATHINLWALVWCFLIIYRMKHPNRTMRFFPLGPALCGLIYGIPLIFVIVTVSFGKVGYSRGSAFCVTTIDEDPEATYPMAWLGITIIWPCITTCLIILGELIVIIRMLYRAYKNVSAIKKGKVSSFQYEKRMIMFLIWDIIQQSPPFIFYFVGWSSYDSLVNAYTEWISCTSAGGANCELSRRPPYGLVISTVVVATIYAPVGATVFGLHNHVIAYWRPRLTSMMSTQDGGTSGDSKRGNSARSNESSKKLQSGDDGEEMVSVGSERQMNNVYSQESENNISLQNNGSQNVVIRDEPVVHEDNNQSDEESDRSDSSRSDSEKGNDSERGSDTESDSQ